jgi:hypothetical protein
VINDFQPLFQGVNQDTPQAGTDLAACSCCLCASSAIDGCRCCCYKQARALSQSGLPAYGLILDVLDEQALGFYNSFEVFQAFTDDSMRLFVGMITIADL